MTWQNLSSKEVYKNRYMTVTEDELLTDHGDQVIYGIVHKEPAVWIIPYKDKKVLLVGQYRNVVNSFSWEFPAGHAEANTPQAAALLELKEETGLLAKQVLQIGLFWVAPGHLTQVGHVYLATDFTVGEQELEVSEKGMEMRWVTLSELSGMITDGTIKDGPTITALKFFEMHLTSQKYHE
jgi:8-oxo-dGTP pyrophosphatase MutT (NUDIX family)